MSCEVQHVCTSANLEVVVLVADQHLDVWKVCHIHSAHTRIGFVCFCGLLCLCVFDHFNGSCAAVNIIIIIIITYV